jgi:hypothetical protein
MARGARAIASEDLASPFVTAGRLLSEIGSSISRFIAEFAFAGDLPAAGIPVAFEMLRLRGSRRTVS